MEIIFVGFFWLTILLISHSYIIYPFSLRIIALFTGKSRGPKPKLTLLPSVSIIVSAYNEEKVIADRIENIRNLDYDFNKIELIIGSDCSTDETNSILTRKSNEYDWIKTQLYSTRRGKAIVLNELVKQARNEILVFTDANSRFEKKALQNLVAGFENVKVGGVCGRLNLDESLNKFGQTNKEKLYWKYETHLKKLEGELGILIAANGGIYAVRKNLFIPFPFDKAITDDLYQTFAIHSQGHDFLFESDANASEDVSKEISTEFNRKVRFAATNFQTLSFFKNLLFKRRIIISYALWSHKIIRWFVPLLLILLLLINFHLFNYNQFYHITFKVQIVFYLFATVGFLLNLFRINIPPFSIIYYYIITNIALFVGLLKFITKRHSTVWDSTPR